MIESEKVETDELNEKTDEVEKCDEPASLVKEYKDIVSTQQNITCISYHQGKVFKRFKEEEKFIKLVKAFKVTWYKDNACIWYKYHKADRQLMKTPLKFNFLKKIPLKISKIYITKTPLNFIR